jgi:membrane protein YdbS with pleckstrin-like domain
MRYADTLLIEGEEVALRTRQHWLAFLINARAGFILWIVAVALLVAANWFVLTKPFTDIVGVVALIMFALGLLIVIVRLWQWWAQDYMVTNRRLMKVWGVFNKRSVDSALEHINDAQLDQSFFGRLLGYGHLDILTASTETTLDDYDMIRDPKGFKKVMLTQKHALETGYRAPTPPLRASASEAAELTVTPPPAPAAAPAPAAPVPPATAERDDTLEVTQTLARLADLRDRGAISAEEYEAKKRELLGRL